MPSQPLWCIRNTINPRLLLILLQVFLTSFNLLLILSIGRSGIRAFVLTKLFIQNTTFYRIGRLCYRTLNTRKFYYFNILFVSAFSNQFQHSPGVLRARASQRRLHRVRCSSFPIWLDFCKKKIFPLKMIILGIAPSINFERRLSRFSRVGASLHFTFPACMLSAKLK